MSETITLAQLEKKLQQLQAAPDFAADGQIGDDESGGGGRRGHAA